MCWLIRLQNPVHSRLFEACADPEGWAGGGGGGKVAFAKHTYISNKPFFEYVQIELWPDLTGRLWFLIT